MRFMKGEIFMNQEIIKVELLTKDPDSDILRFYVGDSPRDVNLNDPNCQSALKSVFAILLKKIMQEDIKLELEIAEDFKRGMYKEVCTEYIGDLNNELDRVKGEIRSGLEEN